jgi:hypothetical protein
VNLTTACPSPKGPSAVTWTAMAGRVSTMLAWPEASVVTMRLDRVPASVVKRMLAPALEARDDTVGDGAEEVPRSLALEILWRLKPEHGASQ